MPELRRPKMVATLADAWGVAHAIHRDKTAKELATPPARSCAYCLKLFIPPRASSRMQYHSDRCRQRARKLRDDARHALERDPRIHPSAPDLVRYCVIGTTGWKILAGGSHGGGPRSAATSYSVVDQADGREVELIEPAGRYSRGARKRAIRLCDELNADELDWELGRGVYA